MKGSPNETKETKRKGKGRVTMYSWAVSSMGVSEGVPGTEVPCSDLSLFTERVILSRFNEFRFSVKDKAREVASENFDFPGRKESRISKSCFSNRAEAKKKKKMS